MPTANNKERQTDKRIKDWTQSNEDGYYFPAQQEAAIDEDEFSFDDICEDIEFAFRENFEKTVLHIH